MAGKAGKIGQGKEINDAQVTKLDDEIFEGQIQSVLYFIKSCA